MFSTKKNQKSILGLFKLILVSISLTLLFHSASLAVVSNEIVVFNKAVIASSVSSSRLSAVNIISGTGLKFTSKNATFATSKTGNNVEGTFEYVNAGVKTSITGFIQGKFTSGSNTTGLYFRSTSLSPEKHFALVVPSFEANADFESAATPQFNSSGPDAALEALKTTQSSAGSIVASITDPSTVRENGGTTVTFQLSFNLSRTGSASMSFTPTLEAGTSTADSDYSTTFQYSTDNISYSDVSGAISVSATTNLIYLKASILDDNTPESSETFSLYTNSFSGTGASQLANSTGVVGIATITDDGDPYVWNGTTSTDWSVSSNWTPNDSGRPNSNDNVKIPSGTPNSAALSSSVSVNNIQLLSGAIVNLNTFDLNVSGSLENNGSMNGSGNSGKVSLTGNSTASDISGTGEIDNLELNNSNGANISSGNQTLNNGYFPTNGVLTTGGRLVFNSTSTQTATVFAKSGSCSTYISGNVTVKRYVDISGNTTFRFLGHPFAESKLLSSFTNLPISNAYSYNSLFATPNPSAPSGDPAWVKLTSSDTWAQNKGIISLINMTNNPTPFTISAFGNLNQCSVTIPLSSVSNNDGNLGWVLLANPFAAYLDLSSKSTVSDVNVQNGYYVWDVSTATSDASSLKSRQANFNHKGKYMTIISGVHGSNAQRIAPFGGFFIQLSPTNGTSTGSITISENDKTSSKGTEYTPFSTPSNNVYASRTMATELVSVNTLKLINQNNLVDDLKLIFRNGGKNTFDRFDLTKMHNPDLDIYTKVEGINTDIAVDTRDLNLNDFQVPVYMKSNLSISNEPFELQWAQENPLEADFYLYDLISNDRIKLKKDQTYSFTPGIYNQKSPRFMLQVFAKNVESNSDELIISPNPSSDKIYINLKNKKSSQVKATILDQSGLELSNKLIQLVPNHEPSIDISDLREGAYYLKITTDNNRVLSKKIIKK